MAEYTKIKLRTDSQANWLKYNPVLLRGELAISFQENDEVKIKIGDGTTAYALLPFFGGISKSDIEGLLGDYAKKSDIPTANSELTNDSNYITISDVELKNYTTLAEVTEQINSVLAEKDYASKAELQAVETTANSKTTMAEVEAKQFQTSADVESTITAKNYVAKDGFATINSQSITDGGNIEIQGGSGGFENVDVVLTKDPDAWGDETILNVEPNKVYKLTTDETLNTISFYLKLKHNGSFEGVSYILWDNTNSDIDISYVSDASSFGETPYFNIIGSLNDETKHYIEVVGVNGNAIANVDVHTTSLPQFKTINGVEIEGFGNISGLIEENVNVNSNNGVNNRLIIGENSNNGSNYIYNIKGTPNADGKLYLQVYSSGKGFYLIKWNDTQLKIKDIDVIYGNQNKAIHRKGSVKDNTIDQQGFQCHYAYVFPYEESIFFTDSVYDTITMSEVEAKINENANGYQTAEQVETAITSKGYTTLTEVGQQGYAKDSEVPKTTEQWSFTMEDGSLVTKDVYIK